MSPEEYDSLSSRLKKLPGELKALMEKRIELFSLEMGEHISGLIAHAMYRLAGIVFLALGLILILFGLSSLIGGFLESQSLGYIVVSAPMIILGLMFFFRRPRSMVVSTQGRMLQQFMSDLTVQMSRFESEDGTESPVSGQEKATGPARGEQSDASEPPKPNN
ncbi:MAG: phage holin family protein [Cyclonatronaceae bacterium]